jgi:hypothetical protein
MGICHLGRTSEGSGERVSGYGITSGDHISSL